MSYHPIVVTLSSLKPFFFNGLKKELGFSNTAWSIRPRNPIRATHESFTQSRLNKNGAWFFIEKQKFPTGFWLSLDRGIFLSFFIDPTPTLGVFVSPTLGVFRK